MSGRAWSSARLRAGLLAILIGLSGTVTEAGQVRIEGDRIRISVGATRGDGVFAALDRHELVDTTRGRSPEYFAALNRLGPRMRNARVIVRDHPGGYLTGISADVEDINALGLPVLIVGRYCHSACTLFLGARDVCVSSRTLFGFHRPEPARGGGDLPEGALRAAIDLASAHYKPGLRDWWLTRASRSRQLVHLTGRELARFGYRIC